MATIRNPAEGAISGLSIRNVSKEEMLKRTARFKDLKSSREAFVDSLIPGGEREIFNVIGAGVTEDPSLSPAITAVEDFNLTFVRAEPGKGAALHYHPTVEVFMPASGKWAVFWGDDAENEIVLDPLDVVSVPPGVMRGFRNAGNETGVLIAMLGGTNAGRVTWHPKVLEAAEKTPLRLDQRGNVVRTS